VNNALKFLAVKGLVEVVTKYVLPKTVEGIVKVKENYDNRVEGKHALVVKKYKEALKYYKEIIKDTDVEETKKNQFIITAFTLGISFLNCDVQASEGDLEGLDSHIGGEFDAEGRPKIVIEQIKFIKQNPPSLNDAWASINEYGFTKQKHIARFHMMIMTVANDIGKRGPAEKVFLEDWHNLVAQGQGDE